MSYIEDAVTAFEPLTARELIYFWPARSRRVDQANFAVLIRDGRVDPLAVLCNVEVAREQLARYETNSRLLERRRPMPVLAKTKRVRPSLRVVA